MNFFLLRRCVRLPHITVGEARLIRGDVVEHFRRRHCVADVLVHDVRNVVGGFCDIIDIFCQLPLLGVDESLTP